MLHCLRCRDRGDIARRTWLRVDEVLIIDILEIAVRMPVLFRLVPKASALAATHERWLLQKSTFDAPGAEERSESALRDNLQRHVVCLEWTQSYASGHEIGGARGRGGLSAQLDACAAAARGKNRTALAEHDFCHHDVIVRPVSACHQPEQAVAESGLVFNRRCAASVGAE